MLIDTGTQVNFIKSFPFLSINAIDKRFEVTSVHGKSVITSSTKIEIFNSIQEFYILESIPYFDGIIGYSTQKRIGAIINTSNNTLIHNNIKEPFFQIEYEINCNSLLKFSDKIEEIETEFELCFADDESFLPYNTKVKATITLTSSKPVYSKYYPVPFPCQEFVNTEINDLLKKNIIRKSNSDQPNFTRN